MNNKKVLELVSKILIFKTEHCQHKHSCIRNTFQGASEAFIKAFIAKLCLNGLMLLLSLKKVMKSDKKLLNAFKILLNKTNFQLGLFMGLQTFLLKGTQCSLRTTRNKEDGINALLAGFIAGGLSYMTQEENVKYLVRVYLFGRAVDCIYQSQVEKGRFKHRKIIPVLVFALMSTLISFAFFFEPEILPLDTYKMYQNFSGAEMNDSLWHMCNVQAWRNKINAVKSS
ncbi:unnamed protein product [Paramecium primaurelia]|uniref:Peroxisomal membrane protein 4 n=1 Tax=Paramecium primaurelia TaxID=5886 RepID=A0A8S1M339_PARPR|nr:unnamed protein product [Paramecium primaurelia]